ncbi:isopeptide-forming domain-containing fimbrial protein [Bifidobacterium sp. ESL0790]|uniref:isopeptide-forming domain-containing fimbrial protein n=1 Tax=Bifidobacterium sp. ESL0790 TaxID=2983233 RepID=UPI0023F7AB19|nr:isopeptide-forming domain-containing fimbrial protein [Bifidobacterium sp. ESL0790]WEV72414.1 isopeptide-forming domain-containing fimbrial protein [Bifidobacterium sp. ESL0790]
MVISAIYHKKYDIIAIIDKYVVKNAWLTTSRKGKQMKIGKGLRNAAAMLLSAATLLALGVAGAGTASADERDIELAGGNATGKITITNAAKTHVYSAYQIGKYTYAADDGGSDNVVGLSVENMGTSTPDDDVYTAAHTADSSAPTDNTIGWVVKNWQSKDESSPYNTGDSGKVRTFVTKLKDLMGSTLASGTTATADNDGKVQFTTLNPGVYVVVDKTDPSAAGHENDNSQTIPILISSTIGSYTKLNGDATWGTAEAKVNDDLTLTKKYDGTSDGSPATTGKTAKFHIDSTVPLWTGYSSYKFVIHDDPDAGLKFASVTDVKIAGSTIANTKYTVGGGANAGDQFTITFNNIEEFTPGDTILVEYTMTIADAGKSMANKAWLEHSSKSDGDCASNPSADGCTSETEPGTDGTTTITTYSITLRSKYKKNAADLGTPAKHAKFTVNDGSADVKFDYDSGTNTYTYNPSALPRTAATVVEDATGVLRVQNLPQGTYKFTETDAPSDPAGILQQFKPSFSVTIADPSTTSGGEKAKFTLTQDIWKLVQVDTGSYSTSGDVEASKTDGSDTKSTNFNLKVEHVDSVTALPLTGGAGIILLLALIVVSGSLAAGTAVLRRRNAVSHEA